MSSERKKEDICTVYNRRLDREITGRNRREEIIFTRLRIGHCGLNECLHMLTCEQYWICWTFGTWMPKVWERKDSDEKKAYGIWGCKGIHLRNLWEKRQIFLKDTGIANMIKNTVLEIIIRGGGSREMKSLPSTYSLSLSSSGSHSSSVDGGNVLLKLDANHR